MMVASGFCGSTVLNASCENIGQIGFNLLICSSARLFFYVEEVVPDVVFRGLWVDAVRCIASAPVSGVGEAAYHAASMISPNFSVITTLSRLLAGLEANWLRYGLDRRCVRVRAAIDEDRAKAMVLGCAGMTDLMSHLSEKFKLPVVDGVACAVTFVEALLKARLTTSESSYRNPFSHQGCNHRLHFPARSAT